MPRPGGPTWSVLLLSFSATVLTTLQSTDQGVSREASYAWTEQLVKMDATPVTNFTAEEKKVLEENHIPESLWPFVNVTAVESLNDKRNRSEDNVITDEDVADVLDDDGNSPKPNTMHYDGKKTTITISTEGGEMLFQHWLDQALSGLLATVATNKLKNVGEVERAAHKECAKDSTTLKKHAQCVVALLDAEAKYQRWLKHPRNTARNSGTTHISPYRASRPRKRKWKSLFGKKPRFTARKTGHPWRKNSSFSQVRTPSRRRWVGAFGMRAKRSVDDGATMNVKPVAMDRYDLIEEHRNSPLAVIANNLLREVRRLKKKDDHEVDDWRKVIAEIKEEGSKLKKKRKAQKLLKERISMFRKTLRENGASQDTMKKMNVFGDGDYDEETETVMEKVKKAQKKMTSEEKLLNAPIELVREGVKLGMKIVGENTTDFDEKNLKLISPRFFSLLPDEHDHSVNLLSPSLLSLHNDGHGIEKDTSLSKITSEAFSGRESDAWLNFIIEASGLSDSLTMMKEENYGERIWKKDDAMVGKDGQPLYFTKNNVSTLFGEEEKAKVELFERLQSTFTPEQVLAMNTTGYVQMNEQQLDMVYGEGSSFNDTELRNRLRNVSAERVNDAIEKTIRGLAAETIRFETQRRRQVVLSPIVLGSIILDPAGASEPLVLSPALLTPVILSPAIFGCVILSPWSFVPVVLGPRLMSPVVLSPILFSPVILSPLVMDPLVLCPGVGAPFILSPLVLSPFILSPVAISPLILSPFALTPFIGIPHTLSPLILSPFVLSPIVYSPPYISAFVLTPRALSPIIESEGQHFTSILSPSWLS